MHKSIGKTQLTSLSLGSASSCELIGDKITVRLFGLIPVQTIHLANVHHLRLATQNEATMVALLSDWWQLLPRRHSVRAVYVLQTKARRRIFMNLDGSAHFRLRQAIGRSHKNLPRIAA